VLGHRTAVDHWGLIKTSSPAIHVTVPKSNKPHVDGVIVHLTRRLTDADWTIKDGIPVTSVPRTLLDFASVASRRELIRAIEQAQRLRLFDMRAIQELLGRSRGRRGAKALRAALAELEEEPPDTRSPLEDRFLDFCRERQIEPPQLNVFIAGFCVDAAWPTKKVVVELDSRRHHSGINAFEDDRKRDTKLQVAGFQIVRVTDRRLTREADELEADLRSLLGD
jgi:very-short-patch-repair endonuclease